MHKMKFNVKRFFNNMLNFVAIVGMVWVAGSYIEVCASHKIGYTEPVSEYNAIRMMCERRDASWM